MADLIKSLFGRLGINRADSPPAVSLAVWGKHPSEGDHFSYVEPEARRLPDVLRAIYTDGIQRNIDAGTWDELAPEKRIATFDQVFLSTASSDVIVGRMCPSNDQVGRQRYPIIYAAECRGIEPRPALDRVLPELERVESRCRAAHSVNVIKTALAAAHDQVISDLSASDVSPTSSDFDQLLECPDLGPNRQGLYRILYRLSAEAPIYLSLASDPASRSRSIILPTLHLRLPACGNSPAQSLSRWSAFLCALVDRATPLLMFMPTNYPWLDLVIGPPAPEHMFFLGSTAETLTTEIPYPLDEEFIRRMEQRVNESRLASTVPVSAP